MMHCRTMLFMPGNNPGMLTSAASLGADAVIFDLEDAVAQAEKDAARILVRNALSALDVQGVVRVVRMNGLDTPFWQHDIQAIVKGGADYILVPKIHTPDDVLVVIKALEETEQSLGASGKAIELFAIAESALAIENAYHIATAHPKLTGILLGAEDLTAELGAKRTPAGEEILYARSRVVNACRAAGKKAIDTPYPFVTDLEGLEKDAIFAAQLGFDGKAAISPQHVHLVNTAFSPTEQQINWAARVISAATRAKKEGKGVISLDGMMIDLPIIKRAEQIMLRSGQTLEDCHE